MMDLFPTEIQDFASMFALMQEKRHRADYDPEDHLSMSGVETDIGAVRVAIQDFRSVEEKHRRAFAVYMILGKPRAY